MEWALLGELFTEALKLWNTKEANKYKDRYIRLQKELWAAENQPTLDHALIDNIKKETYDLVRVAVKEIRGEPWKKY